MALLSLFVWGCLLLPVALALQTAQHLYRNYSIARKIGVRFHVLPISHLNHFWMLVDRAVLRHVRRVFGESTFTRYNWMGWELPDRYSSHHELGDVFMLVTPGRNWLYIGHPDIVVDVVRRRDDFPRCVELTQVLDVFGPSVGSVEGQRWANQRKLLSSCFNERYNESVWRESISQANDMVRYWLARPSVRTTADEARTLSLDVLCKVGFGKSFSFEGSEEVSHESPSESYKQSLQLILENCILIIAMGPRFFTTMPWLPQKWRRVGEAVTAFRKFMTDMYEAEKRRVASGTSSDTGSSTFLSSLAKASLNAKDGEGLTEQKIYGNIFVINFAGHDTSAHVFTFAVYFLAANPQTICLYTPVAVTKWTKDKAQTLVVGDKILVLPPNTMMCLAYSSLQTDPRWWGEDSLAWRPSRFIRSATESDASVSGEEFIEPRRGTFVGWSEGTRDCPGRKFSQVEFVATMASLFRDYTVAPVPFDGETAEMSRERVLDLIKNDSGMVLLHQMLHPERAPLFWKKR
ncbi:putative cytochrome P450 [Xylariaceae sp. FL0594]|nr:putative cytochrome P450 [Xylariaceae sp. FL0594]